MSKIELLSNSFTFLAPVIFIEKYQSLEGVKGKELKPTCNAFGDYLFKYLGQKMKWA